MNQTAKIGQISRTVKLPEDTAMFERMLHKQSESTVGDLSVNQSREVNVLVRGIPERYRLLDQYPLILGRNDYYVREAVGIDLTPYGGVERGVSRNHAQIQVMNDGNVYLTDLESTNGTFLAGRRLVAHKPYLLGVCNHIMIGCLPVVIRFD